MASSYDYVGGPWHRTTEDEMATIQPGYVWRKTFDEFRCEVAIHKSIVRLYDEFAKRYKKPKKKRTLHVINNHESVAKIPNAGQDFRVISDGVTVYSARSEAWQSFYNRVDFEVMMQLRAEVTRLETELAKINGAQMIRRVKKEKGSR